MVNYITEEEIYENFVRLLDLSDNITVSSDWTSDHLSYVKPKGNSKVYYPDSSH